MAIVEVEFTEGREILLPLVDEVRRDHHDDRPPRASRGDAVRDGECDKGLSHADFVGKNHTGLSAKSRQNGVDLRALTLSGPPPGRGPSSWSRAPARVGCDTNHFLSASVEDPLPEPHELRRYVRFSDGDLLLETIGEIAEERPEFRVELRLGQATGGWRVVHLTKHDEKVREGQQRLVRQYRPQQRFLGPDDPQAPGRRSSLAIAIRAPASPKPDAEDWREAAPECAPDAECDEGTSPASRGDGADRGR